MARDLAFGQHSTHKQEIMMANLAGCEPLDFSMQSCPRNGTQVIEVSDCKKRDYQVLDLSKTSSSCSCKNQQLPEYPVHIPVTLPRSTTCGGLSSELSPVFVGYYDLAPSVHASPNLHPIPPQYDALLPTWTIPSLASTNMSASSYLFASPSSSGSTSELIVGELNSQRPFKHYSFPQYPNQPDGLLTKDKHSYACANGRLCVPMIPESIGEERLCQKPFLELSSTEVRDSTLPVNARVSNGAGQQSQQSSGDSSCTKDEQYLTRRRKNNEAAKRSRDARRAKEDEMATRAACLQREHNRLMQECVSMMLKIRRHRSQKMGRGQEAPFHQNNVSPEKTPSSHPAFQE